MKKFFALFLAALMCAFCCTAAFAEDAELAAGDFTKLEDPDSGKNSEMRAYTATDTVIISGNSYHVVTPEGISITYTAPNENVYCLTQDIASQFTLYSAFYSSPVNACSNFIEEGMHFNIYDLSTNIDIYLFVSSAQWASVFPNADALSDSEAGMVMDYLTQYAVSGAQNATMGTAGGNTYFYMEADNTVFLVTSVNGYQVYLCYEATSQNAALAGLSLLDNLVISAA